MSSIVLYVQYSMSNKEDSFLHMTYSQPVIMK